MLSPSKEPATGILFPKLCNGMTFAGCGVRVKYGFVKVRGGIVCGILFWVCGSKSEFVLCQRIYSGLLRSMQ